MVIFQVAAFIEEDEEDCLQYLSTLEVEEFDDIKSGYKINLHFDTNPYFEDKLLTKEFHVASTGEHESQSTKVGIICNQVYCKTLIE